MALTITHSTVATAADDPSAEINKAEWNDSHVLAGDYLRKATVNLSSAQLLDLHNTPVTLVAAPGAGKYLSVHRVSTYFKWATTQYTTAEDPSVRITGWSDAITPISDVCGLTADRLVEVVPTASAAPVANTALQASKIDGALSDGDSTLTFNVWYSIEDVPA